MPITNQAIPLIIVTGFLGAGKTTVLNRILQAEHGLRIAVLVNDFGAINLDAKLIAALDAADEMISLSNGCICCTMRGDLVNAVLQLVERDPAPQYIVVETSGVSDPIDVILTLRPVNRIHIDSVLTVIDAGQILDTFAQYEVLSLNQIGTADLVLLNKVDLITADHLEQVRQLVQNIAPQARMLETIHGDAPLEVILGAGRFDPTRIIDRATLDVHIHDSHPHTEHGNHTLVFETWSWTSDKPLSKRAVERIIHALPQTIFRAKGILFLADEPDKRALLNMVGKRAEIALTAQSWGGQHPLSQVVVIGQAGGVDAAWLQAQFDAALADNAPKNELERLATRALSWLRGNRHG